MLNYTSLVSHCSTCLVYHSLLVWTVHVLLCIVSHLWRSIVFCVKLCYTCILVLTRSMSVSMSVSVSHGIMEMKYFLGGDTLMSVDWTRDWDCERDLMDYSDQDLTLCLATRIYNYFLAVPVDVCVLYSVHVNLKILVSLYVFVFLLHAYVTLRKLISIQRCRECLCNRTSGF